AHARDEGGERPDDRHESRDDDGLRAVTLVEAVGAIQVVAVEKSALLPAEHVGTEAKPDRVVHGVAQDRGGAQQHDHEAQVERAGSRNVPTANRRESPGKNGVTTSPVSQKTIRNRIRYVHTPYSWMTPLRCLSRWTRRSSR